MSCSPTIPELDKLNGLRTRLMLPEALITAIWSFPPVKQRVHFLTPEYFLQLQMEGKYLIYIQELHLLILKGCHPLSTRIVKTGT